jgi:hypothetical protein
MEKLPTVCTGSPLDRMKPVDYHTTTEWTNGRQGQEFTKALERGGFAGLGKSREECKGVLDREPTCKGEISSLWVTGMQ